MQLPILVVDSSASREAVGRGLPREHRLGMCTGKLDTLAAASIRFCATCDRLQWATTSAVAADGRGRDESDALLSLLRAG